MSNLQRIAQRFSIRNLLFHILAVLFLDMQFLYFLRPTYSIPCFFFAAVFWAMTVEDYRTQLIDLRLVASAAILGVLMRPEAIREIFFLSCLGFFLPHLLQELGAKFLPSKEGEEAKFHYKSSHSAFTEENAPPYLPCFCIGLVACLFYYMMVLPIPAIIVEARDAVRLLIAVLVQDPYTFFGIPLSLFLLSVGCYLRNRYAIKHGYNVVYRGLGDGDIYFLGMMVGATGPFLVFGALTASLIPSAIQVWVRKRRL